MSSIYVVLLALVACVLVFEIVSSLRRVSRPLQGIELRVEPMALTEERRRQSLAYVGRERRQGDPSGAEDDGAVERADGIRQAA